MIYIRILFAGMLCEDEISENEKMVGKAVANIVGGFMKDEKRMKAPELNFGYNTNFLLIHPHSILLLDTSFSPHLRAKS